MQLTNTFTEVIISSVPSTLKNNGSTDIEIAFSKDVPTKGDYSLAPNQYFNVEDSSLKLWVRAKVTTGECKLLNFRHLEPIPPMFLGSQPHPSLVLGVESTPNGLFIYNRFDDKMPLSISGGKKLEECLVEETEDYKIYADGGTQIRMGRTGLAQKYIEALNIIYSEEIEKGSNILSPKHLTSEVQFHSDLLDILNDEHNKEIEAAYEAQLKVRNTLTDEPYLEPLSEQRVFVAINFACRVDKKSGEIYIGEGYENLFTKCSFENSIMMIEGVVKTYDENLNIAKIYVDNGKITNEGILTIAEFTSDGIKFNFNSSINRLVTSGVNSTTLTFRSDSSRVKLEDMRYFSMTTGADDYSAVTPKRALIYPADGYGINVVVSLDIEFKNPIITKTSTPKPFVKSVMPSGKLAFVTSATSDTHSFVMKGVETNGNSTVNLNPLIFGAYNTSYERIEGFEITNVEFSFYHNSNFSRRTNDLLNYKENRIMDKGRFDGTLFNIGNNRANKRTPNHFRQLLIYKDNLTEAELKAELAKGFKLNPNLYLYPDNILGEIFTRVA